MYGPAALRLLLSLRGSVFAATMLLGVAVSGCGTSCYSGFWNGNGAGAGVSNTSCPLTKGTGTVTVQMSAASVLPRGSTSSNASGNLPAPPVSQRNIQHIYVTLRGIDASPSLSADESSAAWQELAPNLSGHPVQMDLLALMSDSLLASASAGGTISTIVPADEYRQLRLRLSVDHPLPDEGALGNNACGNTGWNCAVFGDGSVRAVEFGGGAPEIQIMAAHGTDNVFRVLPDEAIHLSIEFDAAASGFFASAASPNAGSSAAIHVVPVFRVVSSH